MVPQAAVLLDQAGHYVMVVDDAKKVEQRRVTTGTEQGRDVVVTDGLKEGELVIVEGIQKVHPGQVVTATAFRQTRGPMFSGIFIDRPRFADRHRHRHHAGRRHCDFGNSDRAVSRYRAAAGHADRELSGRRCRNGRDHGRAADRGADQRRRQCALLSVRQRLRRQLHAQRDLCAGHRSGHQHRQRPEPRQPRHSAAARRSVACRPDGPQEIAALLQVINIYSPKNTYDAIYLSNYATINIIDPLARIKGVGQVTLFGPLDYSLRMWLDPDRLTELNLTPNDVIAAVQSQNVQAALGRIGAAPSTK
jgi:hypothetical protein